MPLDSVSRGPLQVQQPTLEDVRQRIISDHTLGLRRRQELSSALRTVGKVLGRRLEEVPADPAYLQRRLRGITAAMAGLSKGRWRNASSYSRSALQHVGVTHVPGRYDVPLSSEWAALLAEALDKRTRIGLSRFARYCGVNGIMPDQVTDAVMDRFQEELAAGMINRPRSIRRTACKVWNSAATTVASWPKQRLSVPDNRKTYVLPWPAFPASLKVDLDAYLDRLAGKDILAELDFRPLKAGSVKTRACQLREFISALVHRGRDPQTLHSLADLVPVETVKQGLRFYLDRPRGKAQKHAYDIACVLRAMARHWVRVDAAHLDQLKAICRRLDPGHRGMTERNRERLLPFEDPANVHALVTLPQRILASIPKTGKPSRAQALEVETALAIEILLMLPLRIENLVKLNLEDHLRRTNKSRVVHVVIPKGKVKNTVDINAVLPEPTVGLIDLYTRRYRPLLAKEPSSWMFPGKDGKGKDQQTLRRRITRCIKERIGLAIHPHLFRHFAAFVYLKANPGGYGVVRLLHGHKSVETTTNYYCGMEATAAVQLYDENVLKVRGQPIPVAASRRLEKVR
jgi:integrase